VTESQSRCRLYLITPPAFAIADFADRLAAALDAGDVACVQLRLKAVDDDVIKRAAEVLMPISQSREVAFLINDRADIAAAMGADGVHIGAEDMAYAEARRLVGEDRIVGVSCYDSRDRAFVASEQGADYVAFGAFFPTATKQPPARAPLDLLRWWHEVATVPSVAIGGITIANCALVAGAGADFIAVVAAVWDHGQGPAAAVKAFNQALDRAAGQ
jgi:thiamine-phosphate pyrophosphorylase